jgi:septal ring factor EnvC (AmiA/AmiB activator)
MKSIWLQIVSPTLYLGLLLLLAPLSLGAYQDPETEAETRAAIEAINREIATLEGLITSQSAERDVLQRQLRKTDLDIGRTNNALRKTQKTLISASVRSIHSRPKASHWNEKLRTDRRR